MEYICRTSWKLSFAALMIPIALISDPSLEESSFEDKPHHKNSFFYTNLGGYYAARDVKGIDIGLGYRHIFGVSAIDLNVGGTMIDPIVPFIQASYLAYPMKWSGPYFGAGVSIVPLRWTDSSPNFINLPLIVGYHIPGKSHPIFFQFQYSPLLIPGATVSFGIGF